MLNNQKADALCTLVVIGYSALFNDSEQNALFQYSPAADEDTPSEKEKQKKEMADYNTVKTLLDSFGVTIDISASRSKNLLPLILAQSNRIKGGVDVAQELSANEQRVAQMLEYSVIATGDSYYGAYIGGYGTPSTVHLIGASSLSLKEPVFRDISVDEQVKIKNSFESAKKSSKGIIDALKAKYATGPLVSGVKVTIKDVDESLPDYIDGQLFGSHHGMIKALAFYYTSIDANAYIFEIACSKDTSKVSSCFPCTLFMDAQEKPPTSIHLGRGDNWQIPSSCNETLVGKWRALVTSCYQRGIRQANLPNWDVSEFKNEDIPDVFLEALTYEGSFTKRIISSLAKK